MNKIKKNLLHLLSIIITLVLLFTQTSFAYTSNTYNSLANNDAWYDPNLISCSNSGITGITVGSSSTASMTAEQTANAKIIIGIDKTDKLGKKGALIGLMTALDESNLLDRPNKGIPLSITNHHAQGPPGTNYDSLGLFQQRISEGWTTPKLYVHSPPNTKLDDAFDNKYPWAIKQIMNPAYQAERFFHRLEGYIHNPNYINPSNNPNNYAYLIRRYLQGARSIYQKDYLHEFKPALAIVRNLYDSSPAITLPVDLSSTTQSPVNNPVTSSSLCNSINQPNGVIANNIVQTAINLAWPNATHGTIPTPRYKKALKEYNRADYIQNPDGDDCGVFVSTVMRASGVDPNYPAIDTVTQAQYVINHPNLFKVTYPITSTSQLQPGDILIINKGTTEVNGKIIPGADGTGAGGHTFIYLGPQAGGYNIAQASLGSLSGSLGVAHLHDPDPLGRGFYLAAQYIGPNS